MIDDLTESTQLSEFFWLEFWQVGITSLHGAEDFNTLDRVNAEVRFHVHGRFKRFNRITSLFADDFHQCLSQCREVNAGSGNSHNRRDTYYWSRRRYLNNWFRDNRLSIHWRQCDNWAYGLRGGSKGQASWEWSSISDQFQQGLCLLSMLAQILLMDTRGFGLLLHELRDNIF